MTRRRKVAVGVLGAVALAQVTLWGLNIARGQDRPASAWEQVTNLPPCATEDSGPWCFWDAAVRGNELGTSFWVNGAGEVVPLPARDAR